MSLGRTRPPYLPVVENGQISGVPGQAR